jgi:Tfp pilus assembly protein FimT
MMPNAIRRFNFDPLRATCHPVSENKRTAWSTCSGFSILELTITVAIVFIVSAIAIPNFLRAMNSYRLSSTARSVSDLCQRARYEAIKQNTKITCYFSLGTAVQSVWVDVNGTGTFAANDPKLFYPTQIFSTGNSVPSAASMGFPGVTQVSNSGSITFDSRGAVDYTGVVGGPTVWVLYFTFNHDSNYGAKAITVAPLGRSKVWSAAPMASTWRSP